MRSHLQTGDLRVPAEPGTELPPLPPMSPEKRAALEAIGVQFGTGRVFRDFRPLPTRPGWLAFLLRVIGRG